MENGFDGTETEWLDSMKPEDSEVGTVVLTNTLTYPFNDSIQTVPLEQLRDTVDYSVFAESTAHEGVGSVGNIVVTDKLNNGFKVAFTGGASSVTVRYTVLGGFV